MEESLKSAKDSQTNDRHQKLLKDHFYDTSSSKEKGESDRAPLFLCSLKNIQQAQRHDTIAIIFCFYFDGG